MLTESETNQLKKHLRSLNKDLPPGMEAEEAGIDIVRFCLSKALRMRAENNNERSQDGNKKTLQ